MSKCIKIASCIAISTFITRPFIRLSDLSQNFKNIYLIITYAILVLCSVVILCCALSADVKRRNQKNTSRPKYGITILGLLISLACVIFVGIDFSITFRTIQSGNFFSTEPVIFLRFLAVIAAATYSFVPMVYEKQSKT